MGSRAASGAARVAGRAVVAAAAAVVTIGGGTIAPAGAEPARGGATVAATTTLKAAVNQALRSSTAAAMGVTVEIDGVGRVYDLNGGTPLPPASTEKLFIGGTALLSLGPGYRYATTVHRTGTLTAAGTVTGDLVLVGSGDPSLTGGDLRSLASSVAEAGVRRVHGRLVIDDSRYDRSRSAPGWRPGDLPAESGPLSAVSIDDNSWRTDASFLTDPTVAIATRFRRALAAAGVPVAGVSITGAGGRSTLVARHRSAPLRDLVRSTMQTSDNFDAELLLKELGAVQGRGSTAAGLAVVRRYAARHGVTLPSAADGSGLSAGNRVGSRAEVAWLAAMARSSAAAAFRSGLPVACRAGTLRRRLCGTPAAGRVMAKTGSLAGVVTLAGYGTTASGRAVRFAVLLAGVRSPAAARAAADRVVLAFTTYTG